MLGLLGRRDECKLPVEVIIQFHSIRSCARIEYTNLANQSKHQQTSCGPRAPAVMPCVLACLCWKVPTASCAMSTGIFSAWGLLSASL